MEQIRDDLWLSYLANSEGINECGFLLLRPEGNIQFYRAPLDSDLDRIAALGGVEYQAISHRHECSPSPRHLAEAFGTRLCCDSAEAPAVRDFGDVDVLLDHEPGALGSVQVLNTPGHTAGGTSFRYASPTGEIYLFSGDAMIPVKDRWITQVIPDQGGVSERLLASVSRLRDLAPTLVLSGASVGESTAVSVDPERWPALVDEVLSRPPIGAG